MPGGSVVTTLTQKRAVFPAFSSREVTLGQMRKTGIHFIIYREAVVEMTQLRLRSSSFHEHGSSSGAIGFHECGSGFCSFSHINILTVSVLLKFSWKWIKSSTQNQENMPNFLSNSIW